jgi:NADH-quinone oxidoreductase subunit A
VHDGQDPYPTAIRARMTAATLFFVLVGLVVGLLVIAYAIAFARRGIRIAPEPDRPAWPRYHVRFYVFAILFIPFDMEMAFMYPWAAVFRDLGVFAYAEIGFFLTVLGIGIAYAWREGALEWS